MKTKLLLSGIMLMISIILCSCGGRHSQSRVVPFEESGTKINAEAYLFDAKLKQNNKPTSFRLEVFQTDSIIGLGGRAYLGKGALKGRLTTDSLEVLFPSSNEYLAESVLGLLSATECSLLVALNLLELFQGPPSPEGNLNFRHIETDYSNSDRPVYRISLPDCTWFIELTYDQQETGWRLREFQFENGKDISLKASRRTYQKNSHVPVSKFSVDIPEEALRIRP